MRKLTLLLCSAAMPGLLCSQPSSTITTFAGTGQPGFSGDGGPAAKASLAYPDGLAMDAAGRLFIVDGGNARIRLVSTNGTISTYAGNGQYADTGDGGPAANAAIQPSGIAMDSAGNLYIAEEFGYVVRKIDAAGIITTIAGTGKFGFSGDGGPATQAALNAPYGVAVDASGDVYIADAANGRVRKVTPQGIITTFAGGGQGAFCGDRGPANQACLVSPKDVAIASDGSLYIADSGNRRIRKVTPDGVIATVAGGASGFGDDGPAVLANLSAELYRIALDRTGNLYIDDYGHRRIRKVDTSGIITTLAGNGAYADSGDGGPAAAASFLSPYGIAVDTEGRVYIADYGAHRVRRVAPSAPCGAFPTGLLPFESVYYVSEPNNAGDRLVVGDASSSYSGILNLPLPAVSNQTYFGSVRLASGRVDLAYIPTTEERQGTYAGFAGLLLDPVTNAPFPSSGGAAVIPANRLAKVFAWRIASVVDSPVFTAAGVVNAASGQAGLVPGGLATLYGKGLNPGLSGVVAAEASPWPSILSGVRVTIGGVEAPVYVVANVGGQEQINFQVPWELKGQTRVAVMVTNRFANSEAVPVPVLVAQPAAFLLSSSQVAAIHADGSVVSPAKPGTAKEVITVFATGLGAVSNQPATGWPAGASAFSPVNGAIAIRVNGLPAHAMFAGLAPGLVGVYQLNIELPATYTGDPAQLVITIG